MATLQEEHKRPDSKSDTGFDSATIGEPHEPIGKKDAEDLKLQDKPMENMDEAQSTIQDESSYLTGTRLFLVMSGATLVMFLSMLDVSIIGTAIPKITSDFHRLEDVGCATVQPLTGKMYTYFSIKWTYLLFVVIFEVGSVICAVSSSSIMLILGRAVAGLGSSGLMNGTLNIVLSACVPSTRPMYSGIAMGVSQLGILLGPLLGGVFTEDVTWRWCFYINLPLGGIAAIFLAVINIPEQTTKHPISLAYLSALLPQFDLIGFALFAPAAIMLLLALQFGIGDYGWNSSQVIGLFCGAGVTAIIVVFWERRMGDNGMIPLPILRKRVVWASCLNFAFLMTSAIVGSNFLPLFLQSVKNLSPIMSGVYLLSTILSQLVFVVLSGALISRLGYYTPWALIAAGANSIGCGLISTWSPSTGLGMLIGYQVITGIRGSGIQVPIVAIQSALPAKEAAIGNSLLVFCQNFFSAVFITIANTIFQETLVSKVREVGTIRPEDAIAAGGSAEAVRALAPPGPQRDALLQAYSTAFSHVFYLLVVTTTCEGRGDQHLSGSVRHCARSTSSKCVLHADVAPTSSSDKSDPEEDPRYGQNGEEVTDAA
ncbi:related to MFS multidrug transporter [Cephalotrichum gorgonifer]|uniref:Related to MFS multidrug transporter n=1 Tax=Cephalotrichum gorgonifer TaxID=2041049 RepID=A0AAE8MVX5_9PEZI|nr:related to MFS multidrug transporter [Cephalotrichum gorgonifer]